MDNIVRFPTTLRPEEPHYAVSLSFLDALQAAAMHGAESPSAASFACGHIFSAVELLKKNLEFVKE